MVQSPPPTLIRDACNHQRPNNDTKVEHSLFLPSVGSLLSVIWSKFVSGNWNRGGSAAARFGGGEKVGETEKCIIITNSLHSMCSGKKAGLCCAEYYLHLWTFHSKKPSKLYRSESSLCWKAATSRVEHKGALTAEHWPLATEEVDVALEKRVGKKWV